MVRLPAWEHNPSGQLLIPTNICLTSRFDFELDTRSGEAAEDSD